MLEGSSILITGEKLYEQMIELEKALYAYEYPERLKIGVI